MFAADPIALLRGDRVLSATSWPPICLEISVLKCCCRNDSECGRNWTLLRVLRRVHLECGAVQLTMLDRQPEMRPSDAILNVLANYAEFRGRASLPEFWWWCLFLMLALLMLLVVDGVVSARILGYPTFSSDSGRPLSVLGGIALAPPTLAVAARRLHDVGRSGWWLLVGFVPILGNLYLAWVLSRPTSKRDNRYGSSVYGLPRT